MIEIINKIKRNRLSDKTKYLLSRLDDETTHDYKGIDITGIRDNQFTGNCIFIIYKKSKTIELNIWNIIITLDSLTNREINDADFYNSEDDDKCIHDAIHLSIYSDYRIIS